MNISKYLNPVKYFNKLILIRNIFYKMIINEKSILNDQKKLFKRINWDFDKSLKILNKILLDNNYKKFDDSKESMISQHLLAFCSIISKKPKKILEIGTYDGETTFLLSKIFPYSKITTIDLKENTNLFINSYNRSDHFFKKSFLKRRKVNLNKKNIKFIEDNSFNLQRYNFSNFDLIWIDGDHDYPALAWDLCNSFHLLSKKGIIMCDDIYFNKSSTYKVLEYLKDEKFINVNYILKRISKNFSSDPFIKKHIAIVTKKQR